jgi:pimeloyl-ACP methyl ester carboxylesterase
VNGDYESLVFPMVGLGFPIVVPDLAGYANFGAPGNPPSAYANARDIGKSTLDGARALLKMFPNAFNGKIGIVGHSQGGFSTLASVALAPTYAPELDIGAVATFSPLWISQATWGALLYEAADYPIGGPTADPTPTAVSIWYHYTESELLDGPGQGVSLFQPGQQTTIKNFVDNDCWYTGYNGAGPESTWDAATAYPDLQAAGTTALSFFSPYFVSAIEQPAAFGTAVKPCGDDDAGLLCQKWIARYAADRPHLVNPPPILISYGGDDETIAPPLMACVLQRLNQDNAAFKLCVDPQYGHTSNLRAHADFAAAWLGQQLLGEAAPNGSQCILSVLDDDAGAPVGCQTPPPNN